MSDTVKAEARFRVKTKIYHFGLPLKILNWTCKIAWHNNGFIEQRYFLWRGEARKMNQLTKYIHKYRQRINLRFALQAIIKALISFLLALHIYFLLWLNLPSNSPVLFYANIGIRTCLILLIIYFLLSGYRNF